MTVQLPSCQWQAHLAEMASAWFLLILLFSALPTVAGPPPPALRGHPKRKPPATVRILRQRIKLGMTSIAVNKVLHNLSFRYRTHAYDIAGPEGSHHEVDAYFCSDGMVDVAYETVAYGKNNDAAHVLAVSGSSVFSGEHFFVGNASAMP